VIRNATSLNDTLTKLEQNKYATLNKCLNEIEFCWVNAERYNGVPHPIAVEMRQQFKKLLRPISVRTTTGFCAEVYRIQTCIGRLLARNPVDAHSGGTTPSRVAAKHFSTNLEMQMFITACEMLTDTRDHDTIKQIVARRKKLMIMMTSLRPDTFKAVKAFVRAALKKQGLEYPS
jgi:hypothetical protein